MLESIIEDFFKGVMVKKKVMMLVLLGLIAGSVFAQTIMLDLGA
jgi:hypothetical protein